MNKVTIGIFLFISLLALVVSGAYAVVAIGMSDPTTSLIPQLVKGLFISIPVVFGIVSIYLITLLVRRNDTQPNSHKDRTKLILALICLVLFFVIFGNFSLGILSIFFN